MRKEVKYRDTLMKAKGLNFANFSQINICKAQVSNKVNFIYFEKATKFYEISTVDSSCVVMVKSKVEISQNFVAFSEYMTFTDDSPIGDHFGKRTACYNTL